MAIEINNSSVDLDLIYSFTYEGDEYKLDKSNGNKLLKNNSAFINLSTFIYLYLYFNGKYFFIKQLAQPTGASLEIYNNNGDLIRNKTENSDYIPINITETNQLILNKMTSARYSNIFKIYDFDSDSFTNDIEPPVVDNLTIALSSMYYSNKEYAYMSVIYLNTETIEYTYKNYQYNLRTNSTQEIANDNYVIFNRKIVDNINVDFCAHYVNNILKFFIRYESTTIDISDFSGNILLAYLQMGRLNALGLLISPTKGYLIEANKDVTTYKITFNDYNGTTLQELQVEEGITPTYTGSTPTRTGYTFTGRSPALYPANKEQVYTAQYEINNYTIRFMNDTQVLESKQVPYGTTPSYTGEPPTKEGYTFAGWSPALYPANKNQDYEAQFGINTYTIRFMQDSRVLESKQVNYNETPTYTGTTPTKEGYTFTGWSPRLYPANKNQDYEAQFNINKYTIRFMQDSRVLESKQVNYNETPTYTGTTPTKEGYTFTGWSPTLYPANKNQDYQAQFESDTKTATIKDTIRSDIEPTSFTFKKAITRIKIDNQSTSIFGGFWIYYYDSDKIQKSVNVNWGSTTIQDKIYLTGVTINSTSISIDNTWKEVNFTSNITINVTSTSNYLIMFNDFDNTILTTLRVNQGETPVYPLPNPTRIGYTFTGWSPTPYPATKAQTYIAQYEINKYTIRFMQDAQVLESKQVPYGTTPIYTGSTPIKEGYTFIGWSPTLYPANKKQDYKAVFRNNAFALTLYKNSAENNRIDKTEYLTSVREITGYLRNETNIINPSIVIEYEQVIDFNYVYVSTFNRYYFVTNITSVRTNLWRIDMSCDTLMTYKETILNYECYVSRNENDYNDKIEDKYLPLEYEKVVDYILQQDTTGTNTDFFKGFSALITTLATSPEVNLENENIDITTPFNDLDGEPAKTNIYEAGSSNFKVIQMITDSGAYASCLNAIANALIEDDNKAGYVQSIIVFPIWNPAMYDQIGYKTMTDFYYGSEKLPLGGTYNVVLKGDTIAPIKVATIYISPKFNNFLDYDPYTTYEIWLPFHGWVKLPSEQVVGNYLIVYYVINTSSTKGTIIIRQLSDSAVILQVDCTIGVEIPISTTNGEDIKRRQTSDAINLAVQGVGGVLMGAVGVVTGNPLLAFGGAMMATGAITGGISSAMTNRVEAQGKVSDGNAGLYSDRVVKIRRTSSIVAVDDISKYAKYIGRPLQTNVKLNTLTGYTIVGGVHIENLDTATDNEKTDIENQLRKGVII